jgi:hypothetical protein
LLESHRIDYVLFPLDQPLARWLDESRDWEPVYSDDLAGVWVRTLRKEAAGNPRSDSRFVS